MQTLKELTLQVKEGKIDSVTLLYQFLFHKVAGELELEMMACSPDFGFNGNVILITPC